MTLRPTLRLFALLLAVAAAVAAATGVAPRAVAAFVFGEALFAANLLLLVWLAQRLFGRSGGFLGVLLLVKTFLIAVGAYAALVLLKLSAIPFVLGCGATLVALVAAVLLQRRLMRRGARPSAA